jgi:hypothetical protein
MRVLSDGGGVYVNGFQPGSEISGNWIHDDHAGPFPPFRSSSAIYLDNLSAFWNNTVVGDGRWPSAARAIMRRAGVRHGSLLGRLLGPVS